MPFQSHQNNVRNKNCKVSKAKNKNKINENKSFDSSKKKKRIKSSILLVYGFNSLADILFSFAISRIIRTVGNLNNLLKASNFLGLL